MSELKELSGEEFARRGNALFEERVRPHVDVKRDARKFVVIDIESGDYEVSESDVQATEATERLLTRCPEAEGRLWFRRVGSSTAHHIGGRFRLEREEAL